MKAVKYLLSLLVTIVFIVGTVVGVRNLRSDSQNFSKYEASSQPLYRSEILARKMNLFPLISETVNSEKMTPMPGIYGAWGIDQKGEAYQSNFTPQGITVSEKNIFITAYDKNHQLNSLIYVLDRFGKYIKTISIANKAHVGGLGYDWKHQVLWVAGKEGESAAVYAIRQADIDEYSLKSQQPIAYSGTLILDTIKAASTIEFFNNELWVGYFSAEKNTVGIIQRFTLNWTDDSTEAVEVNLTEGTKVNEQTNTAHLSADLTLSATGKIQGLAIDENNLYLTQSYGNNPGKIVAYQLNRQNKGNVEVTNGRYVSMPPYLEQIAFTGNGTFIPLFESSSLSYRNKTQMVVDHLFELKKTDFEKYSQKYKGENSLKVIK